MYIAVWQLHSYVYIVYTCIKLMILFATHQGNTSLITALCMNYNVNITTLHSGFIMIPKTQISV